MFSTNLLLIKWVLFLFCFHIWCKALLVRSSKVIGSGRQRERLDLLVLMFFLKENTPTWKPQPSSSLHVQLSSCLCVSFLESQLPSSVIFSVVDFLALLGLPGDSNLCHFWNISQSWLQHSHPTSVSLTLPFHCHEVDSNSMSFTSGQECGSHGTNIMWQRWRCVASKSSKVMQPPFHELGHWLLEAESLCKMSTYPEINIMGRPCVGTPVQWSPRRKPTITTSLVSELFFRWGKFWSPRQHLTAPTRKNLIWALSKYLAHKIVRKIKR